MAKLDLKSLMEQISNSVTIAVQAVYQSYGLKSNADVVQSVHTDATSDGLKVYAFSYIDNIEKGRKKFTKKLPIGEVLKFIKKSGMQPEPGQSINQLAYQIQTAIFENGIKPKSGIKSKSIEASQKIITDGLKDLFQLKIVNNRFVTGK